MFFWQTDVSVIRQWSGPPHLKIDETFPQTWVRKKSLHFKLSKIYKVVFLRHSVAVLLCSTRYRKKKSTVKRRREDRPDSDSLPEADRLWYYVHSLYCTANTVKPLDFAALIFCSFCCKFVFAV